MRRFKPTKAQLQEFGRLMYELCYDWDGFFGDEWSEDVMPRAVLAGLAEQVPYDPAMHGQIDGAEPGDDIWVWKAAIYKRRRGKG